MDAPITSYASHSQATHRACRECPVRRMCFLTGDEGRQPPPPGLRIELRRVPGGESLYAATDADPSLYVLRSGSVKATLRATAGRQQVTSFHLAGDLIGLDAVAQGEHDTTATALEDSQVCVLSYDELASTAMADPALRERMWKAMAADIVRNQEAAGVLGAGHAEARVAAFLLNLSGRMKTRGYSPTEFNLRMGREEIGSHLGLTLETVSRALAQFARQGALEVHRRRIRILDPDELARAGQSATVA